MTDIIMENMMNKFLTLGYPVKRIKDSNNRFKRSIIIGENVYQIPKNSTVVSGLLFNILHNTFDSDLELIATVLNNRYKF